MLDTMLALNCAEIEDAPIGCFVNRHRRHSSASGSAVDRKKSDYAGLDVLCITFGQWHSYMLHRTLNHPGSTACL
jgi:hypothetical protein